ncbi:MAG: DUF58 domain-containing protein [Planctomycetes bacterium]|nr:DUF58 domain-containing protein [Planctomycetota bacterium]
MSDLLSPQFIRRLERLAIRVRRAFAGRMQGERRSTKRGVSVEFADYREYIAGDDPRYIDWNAAARMDRLYLKLYVEEEDLSVHLLVDASASMDFGKPKKIDFAKRAAAALAYVGLANLDRVTIVPFAADQQERLGPERGRASVFKLLAFLEGIVPSGTTSLAETVKSFLARNPRRGPIFVLSDLLDPAGWEKPFAQLAHAGFQPMVVHVLSPEETDPTDADDVRFVDSETGVSVDLSMNASVIKAYRARVEGFRREVEAWCRKHDMPYAFARTDADFEEFVMRTMRVLMLEA